ncbi:outer membrane protein A precursor [Variibacter gotjawalensis]|uniref:Outer membrane protein A n=1 Tax=Variibacter gotjawalensis TaxID=1333996 RepID=A0A0S3PVS7_9BRAD|nr:peptidoglycan -binding protein [Variibacter gotjawalensis]NIK45865.1 chemotaxis protein MotB [Variibacter gotjawalensis]RZS47788.1 chemotaxis protein MotB [Variibacter gotjawalensis]BAT60042.1 outer membrane protein A precursor [Variibacter gotjawalensis]
MALGRARRGERTVDYWPGFVDALSTLVLGVIFLLSIFVVIQFYLSQEVTGKDTALARLNAQLQQLTELFALEKGERANLEEMIAALRANLATAEADRDRLKGQADAAGQGAGSAQARAAQLAGELENEKRIGARVAAQVELLNQQIAALRRQLAALEEALETSEKKDKEAQSRIADLGQRLNVALAQRVQELSRFRSEFFGRLRQILANRPDVRIVGDRFVFQSEVFFDAGQAALKTEGRGELDKIATALLQLEKEIPADIAWVMRIDGHTDVRPIASPQFPSNWELSASRAISVVQYLISRGVSPQRLVAAGFGEFQPLDPATNDDAYRRNRRIEMKLTER